MLLDSVIVIDYLNAVPDAVAFVDGHPECVLSAITVAEVLAGTDEAGFAATAAFLRSFPIFSIDAVIAEKAGRLRQSERWKLPDALQAAVAQHYGWELVTRNTKDFRPERHGFVRVPYTI